jgi:Fe-S oxidoreductase
MWDASKCDLCGECLEKCLYVDYDKEKAANAIKALMEGKNAEILARCITCCACREYCPVDADPYDLILRAQEKYDSFPIDPKDRAVMDLALEVPNAVMEGDLDKPALSLCVMESQIPKGTLDSQLFEGMTIVKGGDYYCLIGYVHTGQESPIQKGAQRFIDNLNSLHKDIVFLHDDCYAMVHAKIKDYGISVPFKYMHIFEYLRNYLRDHQSSITRLDMKIAYQQPCASRYTPGKNIYLDEILELIGVERPPRKYEREKALCCTAAIIRVFPELAQEVQAKNVEDALECGADALVTLCPMCDRVMKRPTVARGLNKIFITDLCRMALGEEAVP